MIIGVVTGGAAGALAPPLSDMGGQEYVCAPPHLMSNKITAMLKLY